MLDAETFARQCRIRSDHANFTNISNFAPFLTFVYKSGMRPGLRPRRRRKKMKKIFTQFKLWDLRRQRGDLRFLWCLSEYEARVIQSPETFPKFWSEAERPKIIVKNVPTYSNIISRKSSAVHTLKSVFESVPFFSICRVIAWLLPSSSGMVVGPVCLKIPSMENWTPTLRLLNEKVYYPLSGILQNYQFCHPVRSSREGENGPKTQTSMNGEFHG